ncbi:hypothetical protein OVA24_10980 [Luteolibacter sp. SL250]|uniref:hypothetical protein n=1 Tax=Luteolibacter sp. SL250 TaxID=2995170 RepID=UPI00226EFC15|nr:hypothetical protein [Luteolibacter sp. SL250]WAC17766.1 hypothetical protein OVA24_10980 [Luteolibacter sp. SL250]
MNGVKRSFVENPGADSIVAAGNGRNDRGMFSAARPGIAAIQKEGVAVTGCVFDASELLQCPTRLTATLRS